MKQIRTTIALVSVIGITFGMSAPAIAASRDDAIPGNSSGPTYSGASLDAGDELFEAPEQQVNTDGVDAKVNIYEELAQQIALNEVRDPMQAHLTANFPDYAGEVIPNYGEGTLTVQIKSGAPIEVELAVMGLANAIPVSIQESAYSYKELVDAGQSLMAKLEGQPAVAAVKLDVNLNGLEVLISENATARSLPAPSAELIETFTDVPVILAATELAPQETAGWRWGVEPPWTGGATISQESFGITTGFCTAAFGVKTPDNGSQGLLFAKHCGEGTWYVGQGGPAISNTNAVFSDTDIIGMIWPTATPGFFPVDGRVFCGAYNTDTSCPVSGSGISALNMLLCTSGAHSGNNCSQRVVERNLIFENFIGGPAFVVAQTSQIAWVGSGDSGGPVNTVAANGGRTARGIISAVDTGSDRTSDVCQGWNPNNNRECSDISIHVEIQPALNALGMQVATS